MFKAHKSGGWDGWYLGDVARVEEVAHQNAGFKSLYLETMVQRFE